jgi:hypothetical protein
LQNGSLEFSFRDFFSNMHRAVASKVTAARKRLPNFRQAPRLNWTPKKDNESAKKDDEPPTVAQEARDFLGEGI